ncbi:zinc ribbon domain-containing protein [Rhodococcus sp. NPDC060090]|uniref:zinc ribbon domain-containing protein n=1 Tax=Rhodococcus sp. NPDC060090 TaxID=3347056 RepID=UPI003665F15B
MGTEVVRYKYRLRPGTLAERTLIQEWHRCRFLWNEAVHQQKTGRKPNFTKLGTMLTETCARSSWLREGAQVAQQQILRTYAQALDDSFTVKGRRRPRYKARKVVLVRPAYTTMTCSGCFARAGQPLGLGERVFRCGTCGLSGGRDRNAARVILAVAERGHTGVDDVGHWGPPPSGAV